MYPWERSAIMQSMRKHETINENDDDQQTSPDITEKGNLIPGEKDFSLTFEKGLSIL